MGIFLSRQAEVRSFNGYGEAFHQILFSLLLKGKLKTLQNTFLSLDFPGKLVSKVITRTRSSTALNMIDPQKCPVYLKFPYLGNIFERFSKKISEK